MTINRTASFLILTASTAVAFVNHPKIQDVSSPQRFSRTSLHAIDVVSTANLVGNTIDAFFHTQPYTAAFITCSTKATAADLVVQSKRKENEDKSEKINEKDETEIDLQRTLAFWLYGGFYQGCAQEYLFSNLFPSIFGNSHSFITVVEEVFADNLLLSPFLCLPSAYLAKAAVDSKQNLQCGLQRYMDDVKDAGLLKRYWTLWIPVQFLTFGFVPDHLRVPFIAFVSFFWLLILSSISAPKAERVK